jgi:hypothetical protein
MDMPTATLAVFELQEPSWSGLEIEAMSLTIHQRPRELGD